ncbi:interferon-induced: double-stranded RNA-activated protein kinase-like protein, partial [Dinothrombium tinctorium]
ANVSVCTPKADIFSAGLILFEMLYPIKTSHEKYKLFEDLKKESKLPENFKETFGQNLVDLLISLISEIAEDRPSASDLLLTFDNTDLDDPSLEDSILEEKLNRLNLTSSFTGLKSSPILNTSAINESSFEEDSSSFCDSSLGTEYE